VKDDAVNYTTRKVATRTPECQAQIDAAHAMPGGPRQDREGAPAMSPEAREAKIEGPMKPTPRGGKP
jgi:hypothetical protein